MEQLHPEHHHKKTKTRKMLTLRRDLSLFQTTAAGVGIIIGAGIYALIGAGASEAGNAVWLSFLIGALTAALTGLSYAELSSMFPRDAGEYLYTEHVFGRRIGFVIAYLVILTGIIAAATVALGFAGYFSSLFETSSLLMVGAGLIVLLSMVNFLGIRQSSELNILFTVIEVGGLFFILAMAFRYFGSIDYFEMPQGFSGVLRGAAIIFFAYLGFESIVKLSEEAESAPKIIPRALLLSILITSLFYVTVSAAAVSVLGWEALSTSQAPMAEVAAKALGDKAFAVLAIIALFSTANTVLVELVVTSRMLYGMGHEGYMPLLSRLHSKTRTPFLAILATGALPLLFILFKDIKFVASLTDFAIFIVFMAVNLSLIVLRYREPLRPRPFRVPLSIGRFPVLPFLGILTNLLLIVYLEKTVILGGIALAVLGFLLAAFLVKR